MLSQFSCRTKYLTPVLCQACEQLLSRLHGGGRSVSLAFSYSNFLFLMEEFNPLSFP